MPASGPKGRTDIRAITIARDGTWFFNGAEIIRRDILELFFKHLHCDDEGYYIEIGTARGYLDVEDTVFLVVQATLVRGKKEGFFVRLNDGTEELLDLTRFWIGRNNIPYCMVKDGKFPARFLRVPYYEVAKHAEYDEAAGEYYLVLNGQRFTIHVTA